MANYFHPCTRSLVHMWKIKLEPEMHFQEFLIKTEQKKRKSKMYNTFIVCVVE